MVLNSTVIPSLTCKRFPQNDLLLSIYGFQMYKKSSTKKIIFLAISLLTSKMLSQAIHLIGRTARPSIR